MTEEEIKKKFFEMKTRKDVADILGIKETALRYFLYNRRPENMYNSFSIPKNDGSAREISAPQNELKQIQRKLANILSVIYDPKICSYGFIKRKSHVENADKHINKRILLNIDLKDFFNQIHFGRIRGMLMSKPYELSDEAATTISQLACYKGKLPQGAPSSPILTNMICVPLDNAMMKIAKEARCTYTRYADDITFSTNNREFSQSIVYVENNNIFLGQKLKTALEKHSFEVNSQKINLRTKVQRQEVTGITVNYTKNCRRSYLKQTRAIIHSCEKYGVYNAAKTYVEKGLCRNKKIIELLHNPDCEEKVVEWFKFVVIGKVQYIKQVKGIKSPTYLTFAEKVNRIFGYEIFDTTELHRFENIVKNSIFVVEHVDEENIIQGSAFCVADLGVLTSFHVTEKNDKVFKIYRYDEYNEHHIGILDRSSNEIASDKEIDYALYHIPKSIDKDLCFECGDSTKLIIGDIVTVIGFPNYQKGNSPYMQKCNITSKKTYMGAEFYTVSARIVHGASGGVVLDSQNAIVGIIKAGIASLSEDTDNENQGFVPIHLVLEHMKKIESTTL